MTKKIKKNKKFIAYYNDHCESLAHGSRMFKTSRATIYFWLLGKVTPNPVNVKRVTKITAGAVPPESWYGV